MLCEKCGKEMEMGYGLARGGIGPYFFCASEDCDGFQKFQDPENRWSIPTETREVDE